MNEPTPQIFDQLTGLFYNFGPFFVAIFAQLWMVHQAQKWYEKVCTRKPPATSREKERYGLYFLGTILLSVIFFGVATVAWWRFNMKPDFHYTVEIDELDANQSITAPSYFTQDVQYNSDGRYIHNRKFVVIDDRPFRIGQQFSFLYAVAPPVACRAADGGLAQGATVTKLVVPYKGHASDTFHIEMRNGLPSLQSSDEVQTRADQSASRRLASLNTSSNGERPTK